jgi:hypothetical protein
MEETQNYMQLMDTNEFNDAIYSGKIKLRPNYISATPGVFDFVTNTTNINASTTSTFNITLPNNQYMLIDDAYLYTEVKTIVTTAATTSNAFLKPNLIASMVQNMTISTKDFTYTTVNYLKGRSLSILSNIFRLRSYSCNQMRLASQRENMTFANVDPNNDIITLNEGVRIGNASVVAANNTTTVLLQIPIACFLPNMDKIKFLGGTITLNMNFNYDASYITSGIPLINTTNTLALTPLPVINGFSFQKIYLQYSAIQSTSGMNITENTQKISALYIQRQIFNTLTVTSLDPTTAKNIGTMTSQPLVVSGKALNVIAIPRIESCIGATGAPIVGPTYNATFGSDRSIAPIIPTDNVNGNNADYILNSLFTINNYKVISSNGTVYPSNNPILQQGSTWSDSYNYQNSFVQVLGFNPSGADSNSALTFNQYKNYFKAVITDLSNDQDESYTNNCTYNISFDLWTIDDIAVPAAGNTYTYTFGGDIFMVSAKYVH